MATEKTFTIAGVTTQYGKTKQRFANGSLENRVKSLTRAGCTDIKLFNLPSAMTKEDARAWLEQKFGAEAKTTVSTDAEKVAA